MAVEYKELPASTRVDSASLLLNIKTAWENWKLARLASKKHYYTSTIRDGVTFATWISNIGAEEATVFVNSTVSVPANLTIPANISIVVLKGGSFDIDSGVTLTINGPFEAGFHTVFTGLGTVVFGRLQTRFVVTWWGCSASASASDNVTYFGKAFTCVGLYGGELIIPKVNAYYLINGSDGIGLEDGTTPIRVIGNGAKIKRDVTTSNYDMFKYRSNMTFEDLELEGYIDSGTSDSNVVPANSYGFRVKHSGAGRCDNVVFRNVNVHDIPFDAFYADPSVGGHIRWINCKAYNCCRNEIGVTRIKYAEVDGGEWGNDTRTCVKNASIDFEPEPGFVIEKAVVRNIKCFHKVSFSADVGTGYSAYIDNAEFDGTLYADACGLSFGHYSSTRIGSVRHTNGARYFYVNAKWYDSLYGIKGRFVTDERPQSQIANLIGIECIRAAGWTATTTSGAATLTEGVTIAGRKGIRLENSGGGYNNLRKNLAVNPNRFYSFGCLINAADIDTHQQGLIVKVNHPTLPAVHCNVPTTTDQVERICGAIYIPNGTTSVDLYIGSDTNTDAYDITFADLYFCEGIVDNESAALMFPEMRAWEGTHYFNNLVNLQGPTPIIRFTDTDSGDEYEVRNTNGVFSIFNLTDGRTELSIGGAGGIVVPMGFAVQGTDGISSIYKLTLGEAGTSNAVINTPVSMYFNIDSDNDATGEIYAWGHNAAVTGHTRLMTLWDSGNLRIGSTNTDPGVPFQVDGAARIQGRLQRKRGANVASANDLTLGTDGNSFGVTGTTDINGIATANWQSGSEVRIFLLGSITVKHNTAAGTGFARIQLQGGVDFVATTGAVLTLEYDGTDWQETARRTA